MSKINITVSGQSGVGKTTVATLISHYLRTIGFDNVRLNLVDNEMPPCPTVLRQRTTAIQEHRTQIQITEAHTKTRSKP